MGARYAKVAKRTVYLTRPNAAKIVPNRNVAAAWRPQRRQSRKNLCRPYLLDIVLRESKLAHQYLRSGPGASARLPRLTIRHCGFQHWPGSFALDVLDDRGTRRIRRSARGLAVWPTRCVTMPSRPLRSSRLIPNLPPRRQGTQPFDRPILSDLASG
jgi:hypothetical protein